MEYLEAIIEAEANPKQGGGLELGPVPISGREKRGKGSSREKAV